MRKVIFCGAICLSATVLMAGDITPLNVKTGLWETTSTTVLNGNLGIPPEAAAQLTPEQRARIEAAMKMMANGTPRATTYKSCLTEKDLTKDPFTDKDPNAKIKCQQTVIKSTGTDLEVSESCTEGTSKGEVHMVFHASSAEHVEGTGNLVATMGGGSMNSNIKMESKWLGATCPADVK